MRDRLLGEVAGLPSADQAAGWAREVLSAKNSLTAADARAVEDAFERKLSELAPSDPIGELVRAAMKSTNRSGQRHTRVS